MGRGWAIQPRGEYPADWPAIAQRVKDAADWCCIRCGHPHDVETAHVLTVHHLNGDKADSRWWNLLALCQRCHLSIQGRVAPEQAYLHPHTPWFRPYAAGFYAASILGIPELPRSAAEYHQDLLLLVGQPWLPRTPLQEAALEVLLRGLEEYRIHGQGILDRLVEAMTSTPWPTPPPDTLLGLPVVEVPDVDSDEEGV